MLESINDMRRNRAKQEIKIAQDRAMGYKYPLHVH